MTIRRIGVRDVVWRASRRENRGTNAVLLGDRVTPRDLKIRNGVVIATYATRRSGEPMSTAPSVDKSIDLTLENGKLSALNLLGSRISIDLLVGKQR